MSRQLAMVRTALPNPHDRTVHEQDSVHCSDLIKTIQKYKRPYVHAEARGLEVLPAMSHSITGSFQESLDESYLIPTKVMSPVQGILRMRKGALL